MGSQSLRGSASSSSIHSSWALKIGPHCGSPREGLIWLGDLSLLKDPGAADVDPYAQQTQFTVLEFGELAWVSAFLEELVVLSVRPDPYPDQLIL